MARHRLQVLVEVRRKRPCHFYLASSTRDQSETSDIESKHRFLKKLDASYRATRRAIERAENGLLFRLGQIVRYLESRVDPEEDLMKRLRKADIVDIVYPSQFGERRVRRYFRRFIRRRRYAHWRWLVINSLLLPLTGAMMVIPGPNVFFGWNAFRLISHYLAYDGGRRVQRGECEIRFVPNERLVGVADGQQAARS